MARGSYQGNALALSQLTLARSDSELALDVSGTVAGLDGDSPTLDHTVRWSGLRWPLDAGIARFASPIGELSIRGPLQDYALDIALTLDGADIPRGVWSARGQGNLSSLQLQQLQGELLQGELTAHGQVAWSPRPKWQLQLNAREINPQALLQQLPGSISADLAIHGETDPHQRLQAQLELQGINGHLAGYPLEASGSASIAGDRLEISRLTLNSGRNQVQVSGAVASEAMDIDWRLQALAPGELLPGAGGTVRGTGHIAGSPQAPMLSGRLHGEQLQLDTLQSGVLDLVFAAGTHPGDSLQIQLSAGPVAFQDKLVLDSLNIKASGSNTRHTLALSAERGGEQLAGTMVGGLTAGLDGWQGAIQALQLNAGQWGQWLQGQAVPLELSAETASLGDLCLQRVDGPGELCLAGSWSAEAESTLSLKADALPLSLWQPTLGGDIQARLSGSLAADGNIVAAGALALSPGQIQLASPGQRPLNHGGGNLDFAIDSQGLTAKLDFIAPENGTLTGRLAMPDLHSLPLVEQQAVEARVLAALPDLSGLAAWVPELSATGGSVNADMQLTGTLAQPRLNGVVALSNGYADLPSTGMQLRDTQLRINSSEERPGILEISGLAASGDGHLLLFGLLDPARQQLDIELAGDSFQVYNTRDARVAIAPDLRIKWLDNTLLLRGEVLVPEAEITPTLELNPAVSSEDDSSPGTSGQVIAPSADVVIIDGAREGPEQEEFAAPFRIDNKLRLRLGRRVNVKALGFMGRISGEVLFTNSPQQKDLVPIASGKLSVENGTFRSFGQDLDIRTGELLFNNQPATEPEINLRAVRWIDNDPQVSSAGILLTGPITSPTMELFSRPQLETSEVQSYLLTGRSTGDRNSVLSIGTYVSPRIYVGYGYNTLEKTSEFNSLFTITPRYGVGLDVGEADNNLNMTFTYEH